MFRSFFIFVSVACVVACGDDGKAGASTGADTSTSASTTSTSTTTVGPTSTSGSTTSSTTDASTATASTGTTESDSTGETEGPPAGRPFVYVGTYGSSIHVFEMDARTGALTAVGDAVDAGPNPSFLAVGPDAQYLFAVNETGTYMGMQTGAVASFTIDQATGELAFVNRVSSQGQGPAHVATDRSGGWVLVATYSGGTAAVLPVMAGGMLGDAVDVESHGGGAQSHMIMPDRANDFVFVPNKGLDNVAQYVFDEATGQLTANAVPTVSVAGGAGPRHMDFHPSLDYAYLINELDDTMSAYAYDGATGQLTELQTLDTLPEGENGDQNSCADVHVHPDGRFVYGSNRGHDSIVIYEIDPATGMLTLVGHQATEGSTPRNFEISGDGALLLVANQNSGNIVPFSIDAQTGLLTPTGATTNVPSPSFVGIAYLPR